ncbi:MAG TPA: class I SAM-dependent methyltransferase [Sphingomonas sp.]|nr:class I SAM-dependent methyltransferase [Sphingomonas sp.]
MSDYPYSMSLFEDIIVAALDIAGVRSIVEIGADYGGMSGVLAEYARTKGDRLISIDPAVHPAFLEWLARNPDVRHVAEPSLAALRDLPAADAYVVDGDHNWFTVYNELTLIRAQVRADGRPLFVLLHDVGWPCARRDFYYAPEQIPEAFRHPFSRTDGAVPGWPMLVPGHGLNGGDVLAMATREGGPMNGVLTAVEDFIESAAGEGDDLCYAHVPGALGLGVIFDAAAPWASTMSDHLVPYHNNRLLIALEENRLKNFIDALQAERALAA